MTHAREEELHVLHDVWADRWTTPPPDSAIATTPAGARDAGAAALAAHIERELTRGRSLYCIVRDTEVRSRIGAFDGRVLP